uniref:Uncharacterized protein n=1 Tax=Pseudictyota dubia TaxID=2749911 RepID=A0A7R9VX65_9STRA
MKLLKVNVDRVKILREERFRLEKETERLRATTMCDSKNKDEMTNTVLEKRKHLLNVLESATLVANDFDNRWTEESPQENCAERRGAQHSRNRLKGKSPPSTSNRVSYLGPHGVHTKQLLALSKHGATTKHGDVMYLSFDGVCWRPKLPWSTAA